MSTLYFTDDIEKNQFLNQYNKTFEEQKGSDYGKFNPSFFKTMDHKEECSFGTFKSKEIASTNDLNYFSKKCNFSNEVNNNNLLDQLNEPLSSFSQKENKINKIRVNRYKPAFIRDFKEKKISSDKSNIFEAATKEKKNDILGLKHLLNKSHFSKLNEDYLESPQKKGITKFTILQFIEKIDRCIEKFDKFSIQQDCPSNNVPIDSSLDNDLINNSFNYDLNKFKIVDSFSQKYFKNSISFPNRPELSNEKYCEFNLNEKVEDRLLRQGRISKQYKESLLKKYLELEKMNLTFTPTIIKNKV